MTKEIIYNVSVAITKEEFIIHGIEYVLTPALSQMSQSSLKEFAEMILCSSSNKYQFILTIK